jgi:hypothetical protein
MNLHFVTIVSAILLADSSALSIVASVLAIGELSFGYERLFLHDFFSQNCVFHSTYLFSAESGSLTVQSDSRAMLYHFQC